MRVYASPMCISQAVALDMTLMETRESVPYLHGDVHP